MAEHGEDVARTLWRIDDLDNEGWLRCLRNARLRADVKNANLVSSLLTDGRHAPAIDLDIPIRLVPSSTPGHHHLYIDKALTWREYRIFLRALYKIGLIDRGYYWAAIYRRATFVRCPWVAKTKNPPRSFLNLCAWFLVICKALLNLLKWNITELITESWHKNSRNNT